MEFSVGQRGLLGRNLGFLHEDYMLRGLPGNTSSIMFMACSDKLTLSCKQCVL